MRFVHINLVVTDPEQSAKFYQQYLMPNAEMVELGDSLHLRDPVNDLAFQRGSPSSPAGAHHGFVAESSKHVDQLVKNLRDNHVEITDDCIEPGFRSVKFLDLDNYEIEVYWEEDWP